jgi:hypothetical protein
MTATERWLPVPEWGDLYEVSDQGRVRRVKAGGKYPAGHTLKPLKVRAGYVRVELNRDNKRHAFYVQRLVLSAFVGPRPAGQESCHRNGVRDDNRLANLRWGTHADNMQDRLSDGNHPMARKTHCLRGHEFTPENTYSAPGVIGRVCRQCRTLRKRARSMRAAAVNNHLTKEN